MTLAYDVFDAEETLAPEHLEDYARRPGTLTILLAVAAIGVGWAAVQSGELREIVSGLLVVAVVWTVAYLGLHAVKGSPTPH